MVLYLHVVFLLLASKSFDSAQIEYFKKVSMEIVVHCQVANFNFTSLCLPS